MTEWRIAALAAISEGFCPYGHGRLADDGWCSRCSERGLWWSIGDGGETVIARYPFPEDGWVPHG